MGQIYPKTRDYYKMAKCMTKIGIPYMGSKRQHSDRIYNTIQSLHPNSDTLVDLFCGGFAISAYFLQNGWKVIANDKNKYVIALIQKAITGYFNYDTFDCKFITREEFMDVRDNPSKYEDWYVGYVLCVWSFGNNQRDYLFGKEIEYIKQAGHELVVNKNPELILKLIPTFPKKYIEGIIKQKDWHLRRMALIKVSKVMQNRKLELEQLERLERLEQLERLQQLERLEQLSHIKLCSLNYDEVTIPNGAIVYCDPPYKGTTQYRERGFDHDKFWDWVRQKSKTNPVYVSEYNAPEDFTVVASWYRRSTLPALLKTRTPDEKIFTLNVQSRLNNQN